MNLAVFMTLLHATTVDEDDAIAFARSDYLKGRLTIEEFETEVEAILSGGSDYLPLFERPG